MLDTELFRTRKAAAEMIGAASTAAVGQRESNDLTGEDFVRGTLEVMDVPDADLICYSTFMKNASCIDKNSSILSVIAEKNANRFSIIFFSTDSFFMTLVNLTDHRSYRSHATNSPTARVITNDHMTKETKRWCILHARRDLISPFCSARLL
jgi:hypothetical protein